VLSTASRHHVNTAVPALGTRYAGRLVSDLTSARKGGRVKINSHIGPGPATTHSRAVSGATYMAVTAVPDGPTQTLCAEHRVHAEYLGACRLHAHRRVPTAPTNSNLTYREPLHLAGQVMCMNKGSLDSVWELGQDCQRMLARPVACGSEAAGRSRNRNA
jgi:hypothetical protein